MNRLTVVMYHYVRDYAHNRFPGIKGLDVSIFREQVAYLRTHFTPATVEQVIRWVEGDLKDVPQNPVLLTFDDGYVDHYRHVLPVLEGAGMQGTFFVPGMIMDTPRLMEVNKIQLIFSCADKNDLVAEVRNGMDHFRGREFDYPSYEELYRIYGKPNRFDDGDIRFIKKMLQSVLPDQVRQTITEELFRKYVDEDEETLAREFYMTREQVRDLRNRGMQIGVHGYSHGWLSEMTEEEMRTDIERSISVLEGVIDRRRWVINYPYGGVNQSVVDYARIRGAALGFTVEPGTVVLEEGGPQLSDPLLMPRLDCNDYPPVSETYRDYSE